jgi:cell division transport system permease protein
LLLIVLATIGTVVFTTRTGLAIHREAIEVLHLIGAQDTYIARQFSRRALGLGIWGSVLGIALALPTLWALVHLARNMGDQFLPDIGLGVVHWASLGALPLIVALIAMSTARVTVLRTLSKML